MIQEGQSQEARAEETLAELYWAVGRRLREVSQETLAPFGITPAHLSALRVLARHGPMRLSGLSEHLRIVPRSGTEVADALEARGLAERRPDPDDRRATLIELTPAGRDLLGQLRERRGTEAGRTFSRLSKEEQARLAGLLRRMLD